MSTTDKGVEVVPWAEHMAAWRWPQGDHVTLIGPTKAGKTTLAGAILPRRSYVLGFGCKRRDPTLERIAREGGWRIVRRWEDVGWRAGGDRVVLWPGKPSRWSVRDMDPDAFEQAQYVEFRAALRDVYMMGGWAVWLDDLPYMADVLHLERDVSRLYRMGRSDGISLLASTQQPVYVPRATFDQLMHLYVWRLRDPERIRRAAEISGAVSASGLRDTLAALRGHEVLYVDGDTGQMRRTRVDV